MKRLLHCILVAMHIKLPESVVPNGIAGELGTNISVASLKLNRFMKAKA